MAISCLYDLFLKNGGVVDPKIKGKDLAVQKDKAELICRISKVACQAFLQGKLSQFDALVGEESCQLRTCKIAELYKSEPFKQEVAEVMNQVDEAAFPQKMLQVSSDVRFIVLAYLLARAKTKVEGDDLYIYKEKTAGKNLKQFAKGLDRLGNNFYQSVVRVAKIQLSKLSIAYADPNATLPVKILQQTNQKCIPCFGGMDLLLQKMLNTNQKVLVNVTLANKQKKSCGEVKLLYGPNIAKDGFEPLPLEALERDTPLVVFAGNSINEQHSKDTIENFKKQFTALKLSDVILANAAQHRQFVDPSLDRELPVDARRDRYLAMAVELGCTLTNKSLFTISHIYATTTGEMEDKQK